MNDLRAVKDIKEYDSVASRHISSQFLSRPFTFFFPPSPHLFLSIYVPVNVHIQCSYSMHL